MADWQVWQLRPMRARPASPAPRYCARSTASVAAAEQLAGELASRPTGAMIKIADFNFDLNGDGKVDAFERKVHDALKAADTDGSGSLTAAEFMSVLRSMAATEKQNKSLSKQVFRLSALVVLLIGALVGVSIVGSIVGGDSIKESRVPDCSDGTDDPRCQPSGLVRVGSVESFVQSIFDLPAMPTEQLAYLRDVTMYVDMSSNAAIGGAVEATFKLAGAYKRSTTEASLVTTNGYTIHLDASAKSGTITMDAGSTYPVSEAPPASGRKLETDDTPMGATYTAKQVAQHHESRRKLNLFSGSLMTSPSFTMMAGGGMVGTGGERWFRSLAYRWSGCCGRPCMDTSGPHTTPFARRRP